MRTPIDILIALLLLGTTAAGPAEAQRRPDRVLTLNEVLKGNDTTKLRWPNAVAAASDHEVAVTDVREARIFFFRKVGVSWSLEGVTNCPDSPVDIVWDQDRYAISTRRTAVLYGVEGPSSELGEIALGAGVRPGALAALGGGDLLVFDQSTASVLRIGRGGDSIASSPVGEFVTGLAARSGGGWLAAIGHRAEIAVFGANGTRVDSWDLPPDGPVAAWPSGIATDADGRIFIADQSNGRLLVLDATGRWIGLGSREGWDIGLLLRPTDLTSLPGGNLLVADRGNGRAQIFRPTGGP